MNEYEVISLLVCSGNTDIKEKKKRLRLNLLSIWGENEMVKS